MFEKRDLFKDFTRADAIKAQEQRVKARAFELDRRRLEENSAIIESPGEGCIYCIDGAKSVREADQIDMCREHIAYLPIYMDIHNQRPSWCRGFARNGTGLAAGPIEQPNEKQEELSL
jgi:hypothetical protein